MSKIYAIVPKGAEVIISESLKQITKLIPDGELVRRVLRGEPGNLRVQIGEMDLIQIERDDPIRSTLRNVTIGE